MSLARQIETAVQASSASWWRYAVSRLRRREDADDVVQDALFRTLRAKPHLKSGEDASRYVWTVIRITSVTAIGRSRNVRAAPLVEETLRQSEQAFLRSPLDILLATEAEEERARILESVLSELTKLPNETRQAIELHILREPPLLLREIAAIQGVAISTVHYRVDTGLETVAMAISRRRDDQ